MNSILSFRKCTLTNDQLIEKVDQLTDEMYKTGKIPCRQIPARPDKDYDLLVGELLVRFKELNEALENKDIRGQFREMVAYLLRSERTEDPETIDSYTDTFMNGAKIYHMSMIDEPFIVQPATDQPTSEND